MDKLNFLQQLHTERAVLQSELENLNDAIRGIDALIGRYSVMSQPIKSLKQEDLFKNEQPDFSKFTIAPKRAYKRSENSVGGRVLEALELIGKGTANQVGDALAELYPNDFELQKARDTAKFQLSKLNGKGNVVGEKIFGKNSFMYSYVKS